MCCSFLLKLGSWRLSCDEIIYRTTNLQAPVPRSPRQLQPTAHVDWPTEAIQPRFNTGLEGLGLPPDLSKLQPPTVARMSCGTRSEHDNRSPTNLPSRLSHLAPLCLLYCLRRLRFSNAAGVNWIVSTTTTTTVPVLY